MKMKKCGVMCAASALVLTVIGASPASAQSASKAGLTMSSGSAIGVYIPLGDQVTIRPQIAFQRTTAELPVGGSTTATTWSPGVSLLLTLKTWDSTRLYVSPQYVYSRGNAESNGSESKGTAHSVTGIIGAQHTLGSRFAVFGEVGMGWSKAESKSSTGTAGATSRVWTTRSTIGGILFF